MAGVLYPYTENDAKNFIERAKNNDENVKIALAIVLKENNKVIGGTEIRNINKKDGTAGVVEYGLMKNIKRMVMVQRLSVAETNIVLML